MEKINLETSHQNLTFYSGSTNTPLTALKPTSEPTLQLKVKPKSEIIITRAQLYWATYLFKQYGLAKPHWLRRQFIINQRRRKLLNDVLYEANVGSDFCEQYTSTCDWSHHLHSFWHTVNGVQLCT